MKTTNNFVPEIAELLQKYTVELMDKRTYIPIHVDEITSKLAKSYETLRKVIDWKDDAVLRRGAIERILKRLLFTKVSGLSTKLIDPEKVAERIAVELIRGGHLPNDTVPRHRVSEVGNALIKYIFLLEELSHYKAWDVKSKINYSTFVLEIASCEIEEILTRPIKEYGLIEAMAKILTKRIVIHPANLLTEEQKARQIYAATCRAIYELDDNFIIYQLLTQKYKNWRTPSEGEMGEIAANLSTDWKIIEEEINQPISTKFLTVSEKVDTIFLLLDDILESYKKRPKKLLKIFNDKKLLLAQINKRYEIRLKTLKRRLFRLAVFSTLSVFLSNWFTFFIVEVPLAQLFYERFNLTAAIADFLIPTFVMFMLVVIIRPPKKNNIKKVRTITLGMVYANEGQENFQVKVGSNKLSIFKIVMYSFYSLTMVSVFYAISYVFYAAKLPMTSVAFDTFTIALTVFAAVSIKGKARELSVDQHTSVSDFLLDIISVPIAKVGSIFASKWKEYNIVAILFNYLVETPFVIILDFIQEWSEFITERKAELR